MAEQMSRHSSDAPTHGPPRPAWSGLDRLAERPAVSLFLVGAIALLGSALVGLLSGYPWPYNHDQFSYLLSADTFASGRLTNPAHPMWQHFESFHVLVQPTYTSKYPPLQGLALAVGQVVGGHPAWGIWLSVGVMSAALYWMFVAWLPARWALIGGGLAALQLGVVGYWAQSYWGGAVAATGGALLFGSLRRLVEVPRARDGLLLGVGLVILANTRPFEGFVVGLIAAGVLVFALIRRRATLLRPFFRRAAPGTVAVLLLGGAGMATFHKQATGDPFEMPYRLHAKTYSVGSFLPGSTPRPEPEYRHEVLREFHAIHGNERLQRLRQPGVFARAAAAKLLYLHLFFLGPLGLLPLLTLRATLRKPWMLLAAATVVGLTGLSLYTNAYPHYLAPVTGLLLVVIIDALRGLGGSKWRWISGRRLLEVTLVAFAAITVGRVFIHFVPLSPTYGFEEQHHEITTRLESEPGTHLVIVRYLDGHHYFHEWVYNRADIDASKVVWARDMGEDKNRELIAYYGNRTPWLLEAGNSDRKARPGEAEEVILRPYTAPSPSADDGM